MHYIRYLPAFLCFMFSATPSLAEFGDCTSDEYLHELPGLTAEESIDCVEHFRFTFDTPNGPREIRAISDISAGWAVPPTLVAAVERGARQAVQALDRLGEYVVDDVTLFLYDGTYEFRRTQRPLGATRNASGNRSTVSNECLVTLYGLNARRPLDNIAVITAHEVFHCVQVATLSQAQMDSYYELGDWWIEGSAVYFSAIAVASSYDYTDLSRGFGTRVMAGRSLIEMSYGASTFFHWFGQTYGPEELISFLRGMASTSGADAQYAAMRTALSDQEWLDFAQTYTDGRIRHPQGRLLSSSPRPLQVFQITEPQTMTIEAAPFTIQYYHFEYDCGTWGTTVAPRNANVGTRRESDDKWSIWPEEFDVRDDGTGRLRVAVMHTGSETQTFEIEIERRRACEPCGPTDNVDACVMGTWELTSGGPLEWLQSKGLPVQNIDMGPMVVTYLSDGTFRTGAAKLSFDVDEGEDRINAQGDAAPAAGRWSAEGNKLFVCVDAGAVSGEVTGRNTRLPVAQPGMGQVETDYSCSKSEMKTLTPIPGMGKYPSTYTLRAK